VKLSAALKLSSSESNGWLANGIGTAQPASASQFVRSHLLRPDGLAETDAIL
jgi:hypothetical protein